MPHPLHKSPENDLLSHILEELKALRQDLSAGQVNVERLRGDLSIVIAKIETKVENLSHVTQELKDVLETNGLFSRLSVIETDGKTMREDIDSITSTINNDKARFLGTVSAAIVATVSAIVTALIAAMHGGR